MDIRLESFVCSPGCLSVIRISRCEAFTECEKETKEGSARKRLKVRHKLFGSFLRQTAMLHTFRTAQRSSVLPSSTSASLFTFLRIADSHGS